MRCHHVFTHQPGTPVVHASGTEQEFGWSILTERETADRLIPEFLPSLVQLVCERDVLELINRLVSGRDDQRHQC